MLVAENAAIAILSKFITFNLMYFGYTKLDLLLYGCFLFNLFIGLCIIYTAVIKSYLLLNATVNRQYFTVRDYTQKDLLSRITRQLPERN